jgi:hypothetical protein
VSLRIERLTGGAMAGWFEDLAGLRIRVFREYPYLYEGTMEYERNYLRSYAETEGSIIVGAFDGTQLVGASTALPMVGFTLGNPCSFRSTVDAGREVSFLKSGRRTPGRWGASTKPASARCSGRRLIRDDLRGISPWMPFGGGAGMSPFRGSRWISLGVTWMRKRLAPSPWRFGCTNCRDCVRISLHFQTFCLT